MAQGDRIEREVSHTAEFFGYRIRLSSCDDSRLISRRTVTLGDWLTCRQKFGAYDVFHRCGEHSLLAYCLRRRLASRHEREVSNAKHDYIMLTLSVVILAIVRAISPNGETAAKEAWMGIHGVDILDLTKNLGDVLVENFIAY
jgi:hypothetical protein